MICNLCNPVRRLPTLSCQGARTTDPRAAPDLVSIKAKNLVVPTLYACTQARSPRHGRANGPSGSTAGEVTVLLDRRCPIISHRTDALYRMVLHVKTERASTRQSTADSTVYLPLFRC